jgi:hypothetical protein
MYHGERDGADPSGYSHRVFVMANMATEIMPAYADIAIRVRGIKDRNEVPLLTWRYP